MDHSSTEKIADIFEDFRNGRREPHHFVSTAGAKRELATIIPVSVKPDQQGCC